MKKNNRWLSKILTGIVAFSMVLAVVGCGDGSAAGGSGASGTGGTTGGESKTAAPTGGKKETIKLWYLWTGAEGECVEAAVKKYNEQSDKYVIESLSVPDMQKVMVAISSNDGPDLTDDFSYNIGAYAVQGIMEPLDSYIEKTNLDVNTIYAKGALNSCKYDGKLYSLPISSNCNALYYNKDLLEAAGYKEPPKTLEEMYEMSLKMTKTNADGTIDVLGFPCFSNYPVNDILAVCGGGWYVGGKMNAASPANVKAMQYYIDYRKQYGVDNVSAFTTGSKVNDPSDPFYQGKQAFRIDGNWLSTMIEKTFKADINYGIAPIPYPESNPEMAGTVVVSSSTFYIPKNSKMKDGAFDALAFITGPIGQETIAFGMGGLPSATELLVSDNFSKMLGMDFFAGYSTSDKTTVLEQYPQQTDYGTIVGEETELAYNLKQTAQEAVDKIIERSKDLF